jgi:hypothetical protein
VISAKFNIVATTFGTISAAGGVLLMLSGNPELGTAVFLTGAFIQVLSLFTGSNRR